MSDVELIDVPGVGTLEAFTTDGLRSLLETVSIPHLVEKTLRYPGHAELMRVFRETGFFSKDEVEVGGAGVRPLDVTACLLFPLWAFEPGEEEFTVLQVEIEGERGGRPQRLVYDLYDEYDRTTDTTSMARTTAFPCTIVARMLARGEILGPGVLPLERVAQRAGVFDRIVTELKSRGVNLAASER
jgi:saccharopine dehydrogenase-like NADP-dependent oxidoreductase